MRGIYVHIPFCVKKCAYCDFYSVASREPRDLDAFLGLLVREMDLFRERYPAEAEEPADTLYFGGGTPTVLGPERLLALLAALKDRFPVAADAEATTEANPGAASAGDLGRLAAGGFNRISIGVQSFRLETLRTLGRIHGAEDARRTLRDARASGFASVGIDLIFGIPGQEPASWADDLMEAAALGPDHVSAYALSPEPGTPLHGAIVRGELAMPSEDAVAEMYGEARRRLTRAGYVHYEISNFAKRGHACRHNLKYWRRDGYLGLGPAAHGLFFPSGGKGHGMRTANPPSLADYGTRIGEGRLPWSDARACTREDAWKESLIAGLRLLAGIDLRRIEKRNGPPPVAVREAVRELVSSGRLVGAGDRLRLPGKFLFVSNEVLQRLA